MGRRLAGWLAFSVSGRGFINIRGVWSEAGGGRRGEQQKGEITQPTGVLRPLRGLLFISVSKTTAHLRQIPSLPAKRPQRMTPFLE